MKPEKLVPALEELVQARGFRVRREQGDFRGGSCVMHGEKLIVLNKKAPPEAHAAVLARFLYETGVRDLYAPPLVRRELITMWRKYPDFEPAGLEEAE